MMGCLLFAQPKKAEAATYNNTYYCINKLLTQLGDGNYECTEDKENKKINIKLLADSDISEGCSFDGSDDWSDTNADWIPLNEMEITLDFNGYYLDFTGTSGLDILYGANVIFANSGGIKTSQNITSLIMVYGSNVKIEKSTTPATTEEGKTPGVPSFISTYEGTAVGNVWQITSYYDENGSKVYGNIDVDDVYISTKNGIGIFFQGGKLNIHYATITGKRAAIENMSTTSDNRICIYDGKFTATDENPQFYSAAIVAQGVTVGGEYEPVYGYTYLYGGSYRGYNAVYLNSGKAYVSGSSTFDGTQKAAFVVYDGSLVFADSQSKVLGGTKGAIYADNSDILVSGGDFLATGDFAIYAKDSQVKIKSGNYSCEQGNQVIQIKGGALYYITGTLNAVEVSGAEVAASEHVLLSADAQLVNNAKEQGTYHITYANTEGVCGNEFNPVAVNEGETYILQDLYIPGVFFGGWYTDAECTNRITELTNVTSDLTLYPLFLDKDNNQKEMTVISYTASMSKDCRELTAFDPGVTILSGNSNAEISYTSSNEDIVVITEDGKMQLTGKVGEACIDGFIPGSSQYLSKSFVIVLSVRKHVAVINCSEPGREIVVQDGAYPLAAYISETNGATAGKILYESSDPSVLSVDEKGNIKAHKTGGATITISMEETADCRAEQVRLYITTKTACHDVYYKANGGKTDKTMEIRVEGEAFGEMPVATRDGYIFDGWYTEENGGTKVTADMIVPATRDMPQYLYAHWIPVKNNIGAGQDEGGSNKETPTSYNIIYRLNKGKNNKNNPKNYSSASNTIVLKNATRKGYKFMGWYSEQSYKKRVKRIEKGSSGTVTLYAKWKKITYKITYKLNSVC